MLGRGDTGPETLLCKRLDDYFTDSLALNSLTCSSAALSSASSDNSEMRMITSVGNLVPVISIFMDIFNVHPPLSAARGRRGRRSRHAGLPQCQQWG